ncbi:MAG: restriction endonuclease subunit S [Paraclostridium sp.]
MNKTPKLRFKEFSGDWESKKVESVFDRVSNKVDVIEEEYYEQIGIRSHGKGIFYKEPVSGKELGNKRVFWVEPDVFVVNIVFAWEQAVAKTTQNEVGMIASHRFPMYRPKENILDLDYITQLFKTTKGKFLLGLASPGGAGRNKTLGQKEFDDLDIVLPSYDEQKKISTLISLIDKKIMKQGEKVEALKDYKKGMMQKIFSRTLRFKDDDGCDYPEWEEKKLGEIGSVVTGNTPATKDKDNYGNEYLWASPADLGINKVIDNTVNKLSSKGFEKVRKVPKGSILATCIGSTIGKIGMAYEEMSTNQQINTLICNDDMNNEFIYYSLEYNFQRYLSYVTSQAVPIINKTQFQEFDINVPVLKEQIKIGKILSKIEVKIEKEQDKLNYLNEYKKGLLQKMFI